MIPRARATPPQRKYASTPDSCPYQSALQTRTHTRAHTHAHTHTHTMGWIRVAISFKIKLVLTSAPPIPCVLPHSFLLFIDTTHSQTTFKTRAIDRLTTHALPPTKTQCHPLHITLYAEEHTRSTQCHPPVRRRTYALDSMSPPVHRGTYVLECLRRSRRCPGPCSAGSGGTPSQTRLATPLPRLHRARVGEGTGVCVCVCVSE